tara:strand:+ start:336 stop:557 length:222 start_codon:yes stop_codon:yes gene_type:complete
MDIFQTLGQYLSATLIRTIIYTLGHMLIAVLCIIFITGSDPFLATVDAVVEPIINAFWYYLLDSLWSRYVGAE